MSRRTIHGAWVLITGASSGIGRELVRVLVQQGAGVVITARREARLREVADEFRGAAPPVLCVAGDITDAAVRARALAAARDGLGGLDILVNNAGVGANGLFSLAQAERLRRVMEVNFFAPAELIRAAMPLLSAGRRPLIVNVGSVLGHVAVPRKSEYCASKFALHGLSDALRVELAPQGIDVLLVSPSATESEFTANVLESDGRPPQRPLGLMTARRVAQQAVRAMRRGRREVILSPGGKLAVWCDRLCPPLVNRLLVRYG